MLFGYNKFIVYGVLALLATAIFTTYVLMWKHSIRQQALLEFNNKQLEQVIAEQKKFVETMSQVSELQRKTIEEISTKNKELLDKLVELDTFLDSEEAQNNNRASSEILKRTIQELSRIK